MNENHQIEEMNSPHDTTGAGGCSRPAPLKGSTELAIQNAIFSIRSGHQRRVSIILAASALPQTSTS